MTQRRPLPARITKRLENSQVGRIRQNLPFRVPLHAEGEGLAVLDRDRLDQAVRRERFGAQAIRHARKPIRPAHRSGAQSASDKGAGSEKQ